LLGPCTRFNFAGQLSRDETFVIQRWIAAALLVALAACGGGKGGSTVAPTQSSEAVVEQFMKAVADSNLAKMANYWGTAKGSAAKTGQPVDYERRVVVIQAYLRGAAFRIVGAEPAETATDRRIVQVQLKRESCTKVVPFTTVRTAAGGWVVNAVDLDAVGTPGKSCDEASGATP
jgi:hypothetical protein